MRTSMRHRMAAIAMAGAILLAGCGQEDPAEFDDSDPKDSAGQAPTDPGEDEDSESAEADAPEESAEGDGGSEGANGARWPDPDDVVAEDVFAAPDSEREKVRVGIEAIIVTEKTMELRLVLTPEEGGDGLRVWDVLRDTSKANVNVRLIDRENLKEYSVLRSSSGSEPYMPSDKARLTAGQSLGFPIFYAPPEDDIDAVDVQLSPDLPIFEDVPLTFQE